MASNYRKMKKETTFGADVIHSLKDFLRSARRGEVVTIRKIKLDLQPGQYSAEQIKGLRQRLGVSQALFAQFLAVSVDLVQAWEQGKSVASPMARRLLDDISADPQGWLRRHARIAHTRRKSA
jgi:putative transcriptional regulator